MKIIVDVGNTDYYIKRAIELATLSQTALTPDQKTVYLTQAISLLGVAKVKTKK